MISKNLFFRLQKEDLKRRIWTIAIAILVIFLCLPITVAMSIGNFNEVSTHEWQFEQILYTMSPYYILSKLITITGAIICGLSGFFYLHSKKKVDLYHSIPVRREVLFTVSYLNGILIYLVPYIINVILCFIILQINHFMNMEMFITAVSAIGINLLYYTLIYTIVIIAVMLTGNFIISCFGTAVFLLYGPMVTWLKEMFFNDFFRTYYADTNIDTKLAFLSPIGKYFITVNQLSGKLTKEFSWSIITTFVITILFIAFSVFLYQKRPSEAAGKAMTFSISKPVIKFLLVIPISLGGGIVFRSIANRGWGGWFLFGMIFSFFIAYAIIEIIYNFDIRSAFAYKKQMLSCLGIIAIIACIFQFDLFHYDSFMPEKDEIKSMSVAISGLDGYVQYYDFESEDYSYMNSDSYQLENMKLTNYDKAYELAELGMKHTSKSYDDEFYFNYTVKYSLNSGREVYRVYMLTRDESVDIMKNIYANPEYKQVHFQINQLNSDRISNISCYTMLDRKEFGLDAAEKKQLIDIYKEELNLLTLDEVMNESPLASLEIQINRFNRMNEYNIIDYYIYPSFEKTIVFLKEHGLDVTKKVEIKDIKEIRVDNYKAKTDENTITEVNGEKAITASEYSYKTVTYKNLEQFEDIFPNLIEHDYYWNNNSVLHVDNSIEVTVIFNVDEYGNEQSYSFYFKDGTIPEYVKEDIGYSELNLLNY